MGDKKKELDYGIFIFRKDLRIEDNRGLIKLSEKCKEIIPIFIFDPYQVDLNSKNKNYLSFPALRFICDSVKDLNILISNSTKSKSCLNVFYGNPVKVLDYIVNIINKSKSSFAIGFNEDFTQYSLSRDNLIAKLCFRLQIELISNDDDSILCPMDLLLKEPNIAYKQYGAFRTNMFKHKSKFNKPNYKKIKFIQKNLFKFTKTLNSNEIDEFWLEYIDSNYKPIEIGSRKLALDILTNLKKFKEYEIKRDILSYDTTHLSAYLNFGLISEREFYWALVDKLGNSTQLINQVLWREYYLCILRYLEGANSYTDHIDPRYNKIKWVNKIPEKTSKVWESIWESICGEWNKMMNSKTGFLIVDAAIQEIKHTGFMHNRCRMIVGVFSVKYLGINPLCRYIGLNDWFSRYLVDCSTSQNKLNTQWVTELDFPGKKFAPSSAPIAGRPMNISNSMIKKWDPECIYIKKWLPHLASVDNKTLYNWDTKSNESIHSKPIFDAKIRYSEWIKLCEK
jgi:deoxyribodipyrimidine photo-lyase